MILAERTEPKVEVETKVDAAGILEGALVEGSETRVGAVAGFTVIIGKGSLGGDTVREDAISSDPS